MKREGKIASTSANTADVGPKGADPTSIPEPNEDDLREIALRGPDGEPFLGVLCVIAFIQTRGGVYGTPEEVADRSGLPLETVKRALAWIREHAMTEPTTTTQSESAAHPPLTREQHWVLRALYDNKALMILADLAACLKGASTPLGRGTIGSICRTLVEMGYAHRPQGPRKGVGITDAGRRYLESAGSDH